MKKIKLSTLGTAVALSLFVSSVSAQNSMKTSDSGGGGKYSSDRWCSPAVGNVPKTNTPKPDASVRALASGVWQINRGIVKYCVRAGAVNHSATASASSVTISMSDQREANDSGYKKDYADQLTNMPNPHPKANARTGTLSALPANASVALGEVWCATVEWKKRPHLFVQVAVNDAPSNTRPKTEMSRTRVQPSPICEVNFGEPMAPRASLEAALGLGKRAIPGEAIKSIIPGEAINKKP